MHYQKTYDDKQWKIQIKLANSMFYKGDITPSLHHYQTALSIARQLFSDFQTAQYLPETLTHTLVISYLNLSDCWAAQNEKKEQICCLIESYDFFKKILNGHSASQALLYQAHEGVGKIYLELCLCLKEIDAYEMLHEIEQDFSELSTIYQTQSCVIH